MSLFNEYKIKGETLDRIANSIRRKYNSKEEINPENFPLYVGTNSDTFWVTHFNDNSTDLEGTGVVYTPNFVKADGTTLSPAIRGWHLYTMFEKGDLPNEYIIKRIVDYSASSDSRMAEITGVNLSAGTINNAKLSCLVPSVSINSASVQKVGFERTTYSFTGINTNITAGALVIFTSINTWATCNPNWSCAIQLRPTVTEGLYTVVRQYDYPIEAVQKGNTSYIPTTDDYIKLFHNTDEEDYRFINGDIMIGANGWSSYTTLFDMEPGKMDLGLDFTIPSNGFEYVINTGNNYPSFGIDKPDYSNPGATSMWTQVHSWSVGDRLIIENLSLDEKMVPTDTPTTLWYDDAYRCTCTYNKLASKSIELDGHFTDNGWGLDGWHAVNCFTGTFSSATAESNKIFYESQYLYKLKADGDYLYLGLVRLFDNIKSTSDIMGTHKTRLWIKSSTSNIYTHLYDVSYTTASSSYVCAAKINNSTTSNDAREMETDCEAVVSFSSSKVVFEAKIPLKEFTDTGEFECIIQYGQNEDSATNGFVLYGSVLPTTGSSRNYYYPWNRWYSPAATKFSATDEDINPEDALALLASIL